MLNVTSYTYRDFFREIPDLRNKKLLDVRAGEECALSLFGYLWVLCENYPATNSVEINNLSNLVAADKAYGRKRPIVPQVSVCANARNLPFYEMTFDVVSMGMLIDHFSEFDSKKERITRINGQELRYVFSEAARVLKTGGHLVGDVLLHPEKRHSELDSKDSEEHLQQINAYEEMMGECGFSFLKKGIGFNENIAEETLRFYFIAKK